MNGYGTAHAALDAPAILSIGVGITRDQAIKLRDIWRQQLRWLEDVHHLPHSFETKAEVDRRRSYGGLPKNDE